MGKAGEKLRRRKEKGEMWVFGGFGGDGRGWRTWEEPHAALHQGTALSSSPTVWVSILTNLPICWLFSSWQRCHTFSLALISIKKQSSLASNFIVHSGDSLFSCVYLYNIKTKCHRLVRCHYNCQCHLSIVVHLPTATSHLQLNGSKPLSEYSGFPF